MSTSDGEPYEPRYTDLDDVPLGSFDRDEPDRRDAIERAEGRLESDVNDGAEINSPTGIHADAVENLATWRLLRPATGPTEARYGDVADFGESQLEYLQTYLDEYQRIVESINDAAPDEIEGGDDTTGGDGETYATPFEFGTF